MAISTVPPPAAWLFQELTAARLLAPDRAEKALAQFENAGAAPDAAGLADFLVQAGLLTPYQADRALAGHAARLALGLYQLLEPVGTGGLGTVFRAVHRDTRKRYAVKLLPLRSMWNVVQAKRQCDVFAALPEHSAVVPFVDIGTAGGSHYLAWPFVEGETAEALVRRTGPLPPAQAARFLAGVADGLAVCHAQGIVHGLIKPSNLLLGPDRKAKILDLGIGAILQSNVADDESMFDTISTANTAMTMIDCAAPETLADPTQRTQAGDLYGLGCVLYYLLTGGYPFPDGNAVDKIIAHQTQTPVPVREHVPAVPPALADIVDRLMRKAPADRPASAAEVRDLLAAAVPAGAAALPPPAAPPPTSQAAPWAAHSPTDAEADGAVSFNLEDLVLDGAPLGRRKRVADSGCLDLYETDATPEAGPNTEVGIPPRPPVREIALPLGVAPPPTAVRRLVPGTQHGPVALPPTAVNWSSGSSCGLSTSGGMVCVPPPPRTARTHWRRLARRLLFFVPTRDTVQLSLFGPAELVPGQTARFQVYAHPPESFGSVRTLSRAFQPDTELKATGYAGRPVARGVEIGLHLAVANAGVAKALVRFEWLGQTKPWAFEVYVPWESPPGPTVGLLTVGLNDHHSAEITFEATVSSRSS